MATVTSASSRRVRDLKIIPIVTDVFHLRDDLTSFVIRHLSRFGIADGMILAVTSKIVSLSEGAVVPREHTSKLELIAREADVFLGVGGLGVALTIKQGVLMASAGIDESNAEGDYYILYPKDLYASAQALHAQLCRHFGLARLGVILTDSHTQPLRRGVTGVGLAHWGFHATRRMIGEKDLFGREFKMTHVNVLDSLSAAAVFVMGEGNESIPLALIQGARVEFTDAPIDPQEVQIPLQEDLYLPVLLRRDSEPH